LVFGFWLHRKDIATSQRRNAATTKTLLSSAPPMPDAQMHTALALKGRLEARPHKESSAIVAASFQLAMIAFRVGMSLGTNEFDE
jgi:hypothetical protein